MVERTWVFLKVLTVYNYAKSNGHSHFGNWCLMLGEYCNAPPKEKASKNAPNTTLNYQKLDRKNGDLIRRDLNRMAAKGFELCEPTSTNEMRLLESVCFEMGLQSWNSLLSNQPQPTIQRSSKSKKRPGSATGWVKPPLPSVLSMLHEQVVKRVEESDCLMDLIDRVDMIPQGLPREMVETLNSKSNKWLSVRQSILLALVCGEPVVLFSEGTKAVKQLLDGVDRAKIETIFESTLGSPLRYRKIPPTEASAIRTLAISCALFERSVWWPGDNLGYGQLHAPKIHEDLLDGVEALREAVINRAPVIAALVRG